MKPRAECDHAELQFGSGDYFIFCNACGMRWMPAYREDNPQAGQELNNQGIGSQLSGQKRVKGLGK